MTGPAPQEQWRAAMNDSARRPGVARPVPAERRHRGTGDRSVPDHAPHRAVPALQLQLLAHPAADALPVALRGLPVRHEDRLLSALRRRHGHASTLQRDPRSRGGRLHDRRAGGQGHVRRQQDRRPRLGRGLLPRTRLGALRPHSRPTICPGPAPHRRTPDSSIPTPRTPARAAPPPRAPRRPSRRAFPETRRARRSSGATGTSAAPSTTPDWLPWALGLAVALLAWPFGEPSCGGGDCAGEPRAGACEPGSRWSTPISGLRRRRAAVADTRRRRRGFLKEYLDLDAAPLTARVEAVLFGGRAGRRAGLADIAQLHLELRRRLRARQGWLSALRASYGLRLAPR